jgi:hypothetical protein
MGYVSMLWQLDPGYCWVNRSARLQAACRTNSTFLTPVSAILPAALHEAQFSVCKLFTICSYTLPFDVSALSFSVQEQSNSATTATRHLLLMKHKYCASKRHKCHDMTAGEFQSIKHNEYSSRSWLGWECCAQQESRGSRFYSHVFSSRFVGTHHERSINGGKISITKDRIQEHWVSRTWRLYRIAKLPG